MSIDRQALRVELNSDLLDYSFGDISEGSLLDRSLRDAASTMTRRRDWPWVYATASIALTDGVMGPYDLPADFAGLPPTEIADNPDGVDVFLVPDAVGASSSGVRYGAQINRATGKLWLKSNAGTGTFTLTYRRSFADYGEFDVMPNEAWLKVILKRYATYFALAVVPEYAERAGFYFQDAERMASQEWANYRRSSAASMERVIEDYNGQALYRTDGANLS